jgi:hypothetical protein
MLLQMMEEVLQFTKNLNTFMLSNLSFMYALMYMICCINQGSQAIPSSHGGPLPDSFFISSNRPMARPLPLTTATNEGKAAAKRKRAPAAPKKAAAKKKTTENKM